MLAETTVVYIFLVVVVFGVGSLVGWLYADRGTKITKQRLRTGIAIAITVVWIVTIIAEIIVPSYTVAMVIHAIMGAVVGYLFSENGLSAILENSKKE